MVQAVNFNQHGDNVMLSEITTNKLLAANECALALDLVYGDALLILQQHGFDRFECTPTTFVRRLLEDASKSAQMESEQPPPEAQPKITNTSNLVIPCDPIIHEVRAIIKGESRQLASKAHINALIEFHDHAIPYLGRISSLFTESLGQIANRDPESTTITRLLKCREDVDAVIKAATTKPTNPEDDTDDR